MLKVWPLLAAAFAAGWIAERAGPLPADALTFLAVGQGDAAVLQSRGMTLLIDAGPKTPYFDAGARLVTPGLWRMGARRLDAVVLTHPDADHIGGLRAVAARFRLGKVFISQAFAGSRALRAELDQAGVSGQQVVWVRKFARLRIGAFRVVLAAPPSGPDDNSRSLMALITSGWSSALLTGDADLQAEEMMVRSGFAGRVQVLKAGHHGSRTATGEVLLRRVVPSFVVVSAGRQNRYGHPHAEMLARVRAAQAMLLRTDLQGSVSFSPGPKGFVKARLLGF